MAKLVTKTYADALFQLAEEEGKIDEMYSEVCDLVGVLDANPDPHRHARKAHPCQRG